MKYITNDIKTTLDSCINELSNNSWLFVKNPDKDFSRKRKLPFDLMLKSIVCMGGGSLNNELLDYFKLDPDTPSKSAFIQQRDKILPDAFYRLFRMFTNSVKPSLFYRGYRLLAVDGSDIHVPTDENDADSFHPGTNGQKPYNLLHLNALYDLCANIYTDVIIQKSRKKNERTAFNDMVDRLDSNQPTILMGDRGYEAYNTLAHIQEKGLNFLIRVQDVNGAGILKGLKVPDKDEFDLSFNLAISRKQTNKGKALCNNKTINKVINNKTTFDYLPKNNRCIPVKPYMLSFRVVRFKLSDDKYEVIVTNLPSDSFPEKEIKSLYGMRWGVETSFRGLKFTVGLMLFHAKKVESIYQEIFASLTMYNFTQIIIANTIIKQKKTKYCYKINFSAAVHTCRKYICDNISPPKLEALLPKYVVPIRPDRSYNRKIPKFKPTKGFLYRVA